MIQSLAAMLNELIDARSRLGMSPVPEVEVVTGVVAPGGVASTTRMYSAFLEGATKATPNIPYVSGAIPVAGDPVVVLRRRKDGWLLGAFVLGRDQDLSAYPKVIASGSLIIPRLTAPGVSKAQVTIDTGLTYVPSIEAYLSSAGQATKAPVTLFNAAGQIVAVINVIVESASTTKTKITAQAQTTLAAGGGPWTLAWALLDRQSI